MEGLQLCRVKVECVVGVASVGSRSEGRQLDIVAVCVVVVTVVMMARMRVRVRVGVSGRQD